MRFFIKATDLSPFVIDYKLKLVALYINNDQFEAAENIISQIMILNPNRKEAYLNMGYLNILRQDYDQAEYNLTTAISFDPDYLIAYENLALLYIKKNNIFLARKNLNQILEIDTVNTKVTGGVDTIAVGDEGGAANFSAASAGVDATGTSY